MRARAIPRQRLSTSRIGFLAVVLVACGDDSQAWDSGLTEAGAVALDASTLDGDSESGMVVIINDGATSAPDAYVLTPDAAFDAGRVDAQTPVCALGANDQDGDKYSVSAGDCNDCDKDTNPGAFDVAGNGVDEDCSGKPDDEVTDCDRGLALEGNDPLDAARSLGVCRRQTGASWGLKSARWVFPDGSTASIDRDFCMPGRPPFSLGRGLLPGYGTHLKPREGASLLAMSSGAARSGSMKLGDEWLPAYGRWPDALVQCLPSKAPPGFPTNIASCGGTPPAQIDYIHDGMALELELKVPSNARELSFDFDFYSTEFPEYVCNGKSDQFVALLYSSHPATPADHNISFDSQGSVVSVDGAFVRVCEAVTLGGRKFACPLGAKELEGSGMDVRKDNGEGVSFLQGGATSWLTTRAPVVPGEVIKLRFAIWDSDDPVGDSTVLIDRLGFAVTGGNVPVMKPPVEMPVTVPIVLL